MVDAHRPLSAKVNKSLKQAPMPSYSNMMVACDIRQMKSYDFTPDFAANTQANSPTVFSYPQSIREVNEYKEPNEIVLLNKKISILKQNRYS